MSPPLLPQDITMTSETQETVLDLLPCPFCQSPGIIHGHHEVPGMIIAGCRNSDCIAYQAAYDFVSRETAAAAWNTRAALSRAPEDQELGDSTRMTSPASRSLTPLSAGWQEISTAPRDGTPGDVWCVPPADCDFKPQEGGIRLTDVSWHTPTEGWPHEGWARVTDSGYLDLIDSPPTAPDGLPRWVPTHWCPRPAPPADNSLSGAQRSELSRLAQDEPVSSPPSTGGDALHCPTCGAGAETVHACKCPSPEMGEISREWLARTINPWAFAIGHGYQVKELQKLEAYAKADAILLKLKENGLSREGLGGSARASRGAAGPSDCAEGDARLSDGGRV